MFKKYVGFISLLKIQVGVIQYSSLDDGTTLHNNVGECYGKLCMYQFPNRVRGTLYIDLSSLYL